MGLPGPRPSSRSGAPHDRRPAIHELTHDGSDDAGEDVGDERFRRLVESVRDYAILMLDINGNITSWNAGAQQLKGYHAEEIIGRHFSVFYPVDDIVAGKPERELATAAADGRLEDEGWRVREDGSRFWASVVITALRDRDGTLRGYGKVTRDLTERRANELRLRASEERFRIGFDETPVGMLMISLDGRYERVNDAFCAIVGYPAEQLTRLSQESITHPDDAAVDAAAMQSMLAGEARSHTCDKRYLHATGHAVWPRPAYRPTGSSSR